MNSELSFDFEESHNGSVFYETVKVLRSVDKLESKLETDDRLHNLFDFQEMLSNEQNGEPINDTLFLWLFEDYQHGIDIAAAKAAVQQKILRMTYIQSNKSK